MNETVIYSVLVPGERHVVELKGRAMDVGKVIHCLQWKIVNVKLPELTQASEG